MPLLQIQITISKVASALVQSVSTVHAYTPMIISETKIPSAPIQCVSTVRPCTAIPIITCTVPTVLVQSISIIHASTPMLASEVPILLALIQSLTTLCPVSLNPIVETSVAMPSLTELVCGSFSPKMVLTLLQNPSLLQSPSGLEGGHLFFVRKYKVISYQKKMQFHCIARFCR